MTSRMPAARIPGAALRDWSKGWRKHLDIGWNRLRGSSTDPHDLRQAGRPAAVLLPGVWETWDVLLPWAQALHGAGWDVHFAPALDREFGPVTDLAEILLEAITDADLRDVILVAHSKGGLVGKQALLLDDEHRVTGLVSCGTPFFGAPLATIVPGISRMNDLRPTHPQIVELARQRAINRRIIAIQAQWDQNVPHYLKLPGGTTCVVPTIGHHALLDAPDVAKRIVLFAEHLRHTR